MKFIITSWICFFLIFSPMTVSGQEKDETLMMGRAEGELSAEQNYSAGAWFAGGLASGFLLGLIGTGIIYASSKSGTITPPMSLLLMIDEKPQPYKTGYLLGYSDKERKKRSSQELTGGLIGTAAIVLVIIRSQE